LPVPWNSDDPRDLPKIAENLRRVVRRIVEEAAQRNPPSVTMARDWHRQVFRGVQVPVAAYLGGIRGGDADTPELVDYEVAVGRHLGVGSREVAADLARFEASMAAADSMRGRHRTMIAVFAGMLRRRLMEGPG
jgi:hypothetical protein